MDGWRSPELLQRLADEEKKLLERAKAGPPPVSLEELEVARLLYEKVLEQAAHGLRQPSGLDAIEEAAMGQQFRDRAELQRLAYEEMRDRYEAQERRAAAAEADRLTRASVAAAEAQAEAAKRQAEAANDQAAAARIQSRAADTQATAARRSVWIAIVVGVAIALQTIFLVAQYRLQKYQADHPAAACH